MASFRESAGPEHPEPDRLAVPRPKRPSLGLTAAIGVAVPVIATLIHALLVAPPLHGSDSGVFVAVFCAQLAIWLALTASLLVGLGSGWGRAALAAVVGWMVSVGLLVLLGIVYLWAVCSGGRCFE